MQLAGGQPIHGGGGWQIPGSVHVDQPAKGPAPMTLNGTVVGQHTHPRPEQTWKQPTPQTAPGDTLAQRIYRGIVNVNQRPQDAAALDVFDALADQLVAEKQAEVDAGQPF